VQAKDDRNPKDEKQTNHLLLQELLVQLGSDVKLDIFNAIVLALHALELLGQNLIISLLPCHVTVHIFDLGLCLLQRLLECQRPLLDGGLCSSFRLSKRIPETYTRKKIRNMWTKTEMNRNYLSYLVSMADFFSMARSISCIISSCFVFN
jgi:hypothetical protein